ncbi:MAG: zinc ribbon domain-containing protein [Atopobiaceae bacterium]|nr:zinc ribbon domain-containing protein [Atopobiaceae bacterium]
MAIINCPACGKEVSDQAERCVHCGAAINVVESATDDADEVKEVKCIECGAMIPADAEVCPNCGFPMRRSADVAMNDENAVTDAESDADAQTGVAPVADADEDGKANKDATSQAGNGVGQKNVKSKTLLTVIAIAVVAIAAVVVGSAYFSHQEQVRQEVAASQAYNQYIDDLNDSMNLMISGAAKAETLGNTIREVWHSAIFESSKSNWDADIQQYYATDFNDALAKLFADPVTQTTIGEIEDNQAAVNELYRKMQETPEGLENAYAAFEDMHDAYLTLTRLATSPTGSLQSFGDEFLEADNDCVEAFEKLQARIPEKK